LKARARVSQMRRGSHTIQGNRSMSKAIAKAGISAADVVTPPKPAGATRARRTSSAMPEASAVPSLRGPSQSAPEHNQRFWNAFRRTDPRATKPFTRAGGFRGTQIDPTWRLQMMTELFGPVGQGWGYEQLDWTIAEGMVFICVRVWYRDPETGEQCWTGPQWGGTEMFRSRRDGSQAPDDECFKMSVTDALGKCLLQLGLGADIHLGQFDDSKYREEAEAYWSARSNPETQPAAIEKFEADVKQKLDAVDELDGLETLWRGSVAVRLREIALVDRSAQMRIISYFTQKKTELQAADGTRPAKRSDGELALMESNVHQPAA
jgi:hypothetical protein